VTPWALPPVIALLALQGISGNGEALAYACDPVGAFRIDVQPEWPRRDGSFGPTESAGRPFILGVEDGGLGFGLPRGERQACRPVPVGELPDLTAQL